MKTRIITNLICAVLLVEAVLTISAYGQLSSGGRPRSYDLTDLNPNLDLVELSPLNIDSILAIDEIELAEGLGYRIGIAIPVSINLTNSGTRDTIGTDGFLWRLRLNAEGATFISLNYAEFDLPPGATYYIYNPSDTSRYLGAFTHGNNRNGGIWATSRINGSEVILEYFQPRDAQYEGIIQISSIVHGYRGPGGFSRSYGDSYACNINVSCPEADAWEDQIHSVVLISRQSNQRICTGTLMNNVNEDLTPYILTGAHCLMNPNYNDLDSLGDWLFRFNYEHPLIDSITGCDSTFDYDSLLDQSIVGASLKCTVTISDNLLLLLDTLVPASFNAFYSGWSVDSTEPESTVTIHHPQGDIKKISFDEDPASYDDFIINHWAVVYHPNSATGLVEPGSSGAALFDENKRVIGTHFSAQSISCSSSSQNATFGTIFTAWEPVAASTAQLKYWLDPDTTDTLAIDGLDPNDNCCVNNRGDANGDGTDASILDLNYLVNYIFRGGPVVVCTEEGNMDGDVNENVNILDLNYLVNKIFRGGPPPPACP